MITRPVFEPRCADYGERVRASFARQEAMHTLDAKLTRIEPGAVDIVLDWAPGLTQQHGFLHAGVASTALDSACGYAGLTLMSEDSVVLTIEFKINRLAPARGEHFRMAGRVIKPGRTITVYGVRGTSLCAAGRSGTMSGDHALHAHGGGGA